MIPTLSTEIVDLFHRAEKTPLVIDRGTETVLDRAGIEALIPHRDPFLLMDRVTLLDREGGTAVAHYDLDGASQVLSGHFPGHPVYPGVLQIETISQAGIVIDAARHGTVDNFVMTHVLAARFIRPVVPGSVVEAVVRAVDDGLFETMVGQILQNGQICAVAAVSGIRGG